MYLGVFCSEFLVEFAIVMTFVDRNSMFLVLLFLNLYILFVVGFMFGVLLSYNVMLLLEVYVVRRVLCGDYASERMFVFVSEVDFLFLSDRIVVDWFVFLLWKFYNCILFIEVLMVKKFCDGCVVMFRVTISFVGFRVIVVRDRSTDLFWDCGMIFVSDVMFNFVCVVYLCLCLWLFCGDVGVDVIFFMWS